LNLNTTTKKYEKKILIHGIPNTAPWSSEWSKWPRSDRETENLRLKIDPEELIGSCFLTVLRLSHRRYEERDHGVSLGCFP
jgi:hypothetical protein